MLFSFKKNPVQTAAGAVLDISPGRIDLAIVLSTNSKPFPEIVWFHSEDLKTTVEAETNPLLKKAINNAFSELVSSGLKTLKQNNPSVSLDLVQVAISAPFSYSVPRTVSLKNDKPFSITKKLINELEKKAETEALKVQATGLTKGLSLDSLSNSTVALSINGYPTRYPFKSEATELSLSQLITLAPSNLVANIKEIVGKYLPRATLDMDSFMALFFKAISVLVPKNTDATLIAINDSSTELCVIREGLPITSVSIPFGLEKLSHEISQASGLLPHEAKSIMKENSVDNTIKQSKHKKNSAEAKVALYSDELKGLFSQVGASLSLPKTIYLHVDRLSESFFINTIEKISREVTGTKHVVIPITSRFFTFGNDGNSSIGSSAFVFHKKLYEDNYLDGQ